MSVEEKYQKWREASIKNDEIERQALLKLEQTEVIIEDIIARFSRDQGRTLITYKDLISIEFNVWIRVNEGVKFMRIEHPTKPAFFHTVMEPELTENKVAEFGLQEHDCKEKGRVIEGELIETLEGNKTYKVDDEFIYPPFYKHKPKAYLYSVYEVEFIQLLSDVTSART